MPYTCNSSTLEAEAEGQGVWGQPGLHRHPCLKKRNIKLLFKIFSQALEPHTYNPSYLWSWDGEDLGSRLGRANSSGDPISTKGWVWWPVLVIPVSSESVKSEDHSPDWPGKEQDPISKIIRVKGLGIWLKQNSIYLGNASPWVQIPVLQNKIKQKTSYYINNVCLLGQTQKTRSSVNKKSYFSCSSLREVVSLW
jgi:hypothetical protein